MIYLPNTHQVCIENRLSKQTKVSLNNLKLLKLLCFVNLCVLLFMVYEMEVYTMC